ncbi:hypothetical protein Tco_0214796 [Tanacetum coccineum]
MDDPNITMEEYIELAAEKARSHGQTFNWETATYVKVKYYEDIDYFKDFETAFPTIVYQDALAPDHEISSKPTVSPHHDDGIDFDFKLSFDKSDDKDYIFSYDKNSFSYKLTSVNNLKPDSDNDQVEINISSEEIAIEPSDSVVDTNVYAHPMSSKRVLDFKGLTEEMRHALTDRLRMVYTRAEGQILFTSHAWRWVFEIRRLLVLELMLRHQMSWRQFILAMGLHTAEEMETDRIASDGDLLGAAPEKVTATDLFYLRSMDEGTVGLTVVVRDLTVIDMDELARLHICERLRDTCDWVTCGPERHQVAMDRGAQADQEIPKEGVQADPAPVQAPQHIATSNPEEDKEDPEDDSSDHPRKEESIKLRQTLLLYLQMTLSPQAEDAEAVKTDESAPRPPTPYHFAF